MTTLPIVECDVTKTRIRGNSGFWNDGVEVICSKCGETTESFGTSEKSVRRCLVLLREKCPRREANFYVQSKADEGST